MTFAAWVKPKMAHKKFVSQLLQLRAHLILCFRAEEKIEIVKEGGKTVIGRSRPSPACDGWVPVCEKNLPYELTLSLLLTGRAAGRAEADQAAGAAPPDFVPLDQPIGEQTGVDLLAINDSLADVNRRRERQRGNKRASRERQREPVTGDSPPGDSSQEESRSGVGSTANDSSSRSSDAPARPPAERTPTDDVLDILRSCPRLSVDPVSARYAVENAVQSVGGWGQCDPVAAAHEVVTIVSDPVWRDTSVGQNMLRVLRRQKLQAPAGGRPESREDRRARLHAEADRLEALEAEEQAARR
jgi:hypothetical protein